MLKLVKCPACNGTGDMPHETACDLFERDGQWPNRRYGCVVLENMDKFYCIECGEVEVDDEDDMCDECADAYYDDADEFEDEEE